MTTPEQHLAELYVEMLNTHEPDMVNEFVAESYVNHNEFVADGRQANRQFGIGFFAGLTDMSATMEDPVVSGIWRVADGMFIEHGDELNLMQMFQQIGTFPPVGASAGTRS